MWRIITGLIVLHIMLSFIDGIIVGSSDIYVTKLTGTLSENAVTANVTSTAGWRVSDYFWANDEKIKYNGKTSVSFLNLTRGYNGSDTSAHAIGTRIYSRISDAIRTSVGYNVAELGASAGSVNMITLPVRFLLSALPQLIIWNYSFLKEGNAQYIRLILMAFSAGFAIYLAYEIASMLAGVAQGFLRR